MWLTWSLVASPDLECFFKKKADFTKERQCSCNTKPFFPEVICLGFEKPQPYDGSALSFFLPRRQENLVKRKSNEEENEGIKLEIVKTENRDQFNLESFINNGAIVPTMFTHDNLDSDLEPDSEFGGEDIKNVQGGEEKKRTRSRIEETHEWPISHR
ncbi:hypothetical protein PROFUN_16047 [Planoprotostelium fungivorum]|uniref:Uncharacterized protein n=1 Tax=Planoprotostelium fungivorum TaxID=1890364 RepID=A0A2P6MST8_9EUKA|nr:hypothetical protein PROFUN_16047 [Planoprotostelium fungivorum]